MVTRAGPEVDYEVARAPVQFRAAIDEAIRHPESAPVLEPAFQGEFLEDVRLGGNTVIRDCVPSDFPFAVSCICLRNSRLKRRGHGS